MDEDAAVKAAPITRLRRRLSVENADEASSPAPLTPSKKRGGKLAAKPQLENIEENVVDSPKSGKAKPLPKDTLELIPETTTTPTKRTLRARSNSSISEVLTNVDSPRARRAARRNSLAGSDNETAVTPARVTRRTRSSINKDTPVVSPTTRQTRNATKTTPTSEEKKMSKQTKLNNSKGKITPSPESGNKSHTSSKASVDTPVVSPTTRQARIAAKTTPTSEEKKEKTPKQAKLNNSKGKITPLSESAKKKKNTPNKSSTELNGVTTDQELEKSPRNSSEKRSTLGKNAKKHNEIDKKDSDEPANTSLNLIDFNPKNDLEISVHIEENSGDGSVSEAVISNELGDQCVPVMSAVDQDLPVETAPVEVDVGDGSYQPIMIVEINRSGLSTSDMKMSTLASNNINISGCEPMDISICDDSLRESPQKSFNKITPKKLQQSLTKSKTSKSLNANDTSDFINVTTQAQNESSKNQSKISNKSKSNNSAVMDSSRNFSVNNTSQRGTSVIDNEKNITANKSTLILSQIKDDSVNNSKSSRKSSENLSDSQCKTNIFATSHVIKNTPIHDKVLKKSSVQTSTPVATPNVINSKKYCNISKLDNSKKGASDNDSDEDSKESTGLLDNEAKDAGDDYESGDSRNASDVEYEDANNIVEKGETLTSDDNISNDTDYEKDSFVVSSDAEDYDLLSGNGDDLALSDNELSMSTKSKLKYNKKKTKEQKKASREMYNARHNITKESDSGSSDEDNTKPKKKYNRQRLDSTLIQSGDEDGMSPKGKNKINISVSQESSTPKLGLDTRVTKKSKTPNNSMSKSVINENEISIINDQNMMNKEDPLAKIHIKSEIITPIKKINMSVVNVDTRMNIEEVDVDQNVSVIKNNETKDPLHETINCFSSSSDNEEIINNFDEMLLQLKENQKSNLSLNKTEKKTKDKALKILDELNITQSKRNKKTGSKGSDKVIDQLKDGEGSIDSSDMRLLFHDSGDDENKDGITSSVNATENATMISGNSLHKSKKLNKRSPLANEDISEISSVDYENNKKKKSLPVEHIDSKLVEASKKKKRSKHSVSFADETYLENSQCNPNITLANDASLNQVTSHTKAANKKHINVSESSDVREVCPEMLEILESLKMAKKKRKSNSSSCVDEKSCSKMDEIIDSLRINSDDEYITQPGLFHNDNNDLSIEGKKKKTKNPSESDKNLKTPFSTLDSDLAKSNKKTNKKLSESATDEAVNHDYSLNSVKKKKNKSLNASNICLLLDNTQHTSNTSTGAADEGKENKRKNKKLESSNTSNIFESKETSEKNIAANASGKSVPSISDLVENTDKIVQNKKKKQKKISESTEHGIAGIAITKSPKNKHSDVPNDGEPEPEDCVISKKKKQNNLSDHSNEGTLTQIQNSPINKSKNNSFKDGQNDRTQSPKKKHMDVIIPEYNVPETNESNHPDASDEGKKKKRKNNKQKINASNSSAEVPSISDSVENPDVNVDGKKKKQKKISESTEQIIPGTDFMKSPKNKHCVTSNIETEAEVRVKSKKNKHNNLSDHSNEGTLTQIQNSPIQKSKNYIDCQNEDAVIKTLSSKKKHKLGVSSEYVPEINESKEKLSKKRKRLDLSQQLSNDDDAPECVKTMTGTCLIKKQKTSNNDENAKPKSKKRKERDAYIPVNTVNVMTTKENITITRLPAAVLSHLGENPITTNKRVVSTSQFKVENTIKRANKPSNYLEESIYLDADSPIKKKHKKNRDVPRVLPFLPTVSTSNEGFTTQFKINVLPRETKFVAQPDSSANFKKNYLEQKIKKMGTYASYRNQRNIKLSKF